MVRPPLTAMHYSGGGTTIMQLALTDVFGESFPELMRKTVLEPVGMTTSTFAQPLPPDRDANAARAHAGGRALGDPKWHVYSAMAAAGTLDQRPGPGTLRHRGAEGRARRRGPRDHRRLGGRDAQPDRRGQTSRWASTSCASMARAGTSATRAATGASPAYLDRPQGQGVRSRRHDQRVGRRPGLPERSWSASSAPTAGTPWTSRRCGSRASDGSHASAVAAHHFLLRAGFRPGSLTP